MKKILIPAVVVISVLMARAGFAVTPEQNSLAAMTKAVMEAAAPDDLSRAFDGLTAYYAREHSFKNYITYLQSLTQKKKDLEPYTDYYIALARYLQLKYLETEQLWDEYFTQGNNYRDELVSHAEKSIAATKPGEKVHVNALLLLWKLHNDQQDTFRDKALNDLMKAVGGYNQGSSDMGLLKSVADDLLAGQEKTRAREVYRMYVQKLLTGSVSDETLRSEADAFRDAGNLDLSEVLYDAYFERLQKENDVRKTATALVEAAVVFSYKDSGVSDPLYAEKLFKQADQLSNGAVLDETRSYIRAYNLEKSKEFLSALAAFEQLLERFPQTRYSDEAIYKDALINVYVKRDIEAGRKLFEQLGYSQVPTPQGIASLYQLGLLMQWQKDTVKAKAYFNTLLEKAKEGFQDSVVLARQRLAEIEEDRPIESNLKMFLDVSLQPDGQPYNGAGVLLKASPAKLARGGESTISAVAYAGESGCMQPEIQYIWSGYLGNMPPEPGASEFAAQYRLPGNKEINLVVLTPTGVIDRGIYLVDVE